MQCVDASTERADNGTILVDGSFFMFMESHFQRNHSLPRTSLCRFRYRPEDTATSSIQGTRSIDHCTQTGDRSRDAGRHSHEQFVSKRRSPDVKRDRWKDEKLQILDVRIPAGVSAGLERNDSKDRTLGVCPPTSLPRSTRHVVHENRRLGLTALEMLGSDQRCLNNLDIQARNKSIIRIRG